MYCLGDRRSATFSPRAMRSRSRWRIFSRSRATAFMRLPSESVASSGMASVNTVATAAIAAKSIASVRVSPILFIIRSNSMARPSEVEIDHFAHDEDAHRHPDRGAGEHRPSGRMRPKKLDVLRAGQVDEDHHREWKAGDNGGGGFRLHRHRLNLGLHLFALAQHLGQISERFRQVAAGPLLDRDDDAEEIGLRHRDALVELAAGLADRHADALCVRGCFELAL